ncbi:MAG: protein-glutamate O-methyltransferase CheR [Pseudomonadota bacterium]
MNEDNDTYFELILKKLNERHGFDFSQYREGTIKRRLERRAALTGAGDCREYADILESDPEEFKRLIKELTIKVSRFFRNHYVFERLSDEILPDLFESKKDDDNRSLRVWCAGCAFGEEVYSVAISLSDYMHKSDKNMMDYNISIFGTDIDDEALDRARLGVYNNEAVAEVRKKILDTYFTCDGGNNYSVVDSIRGVVNFCNHDITSRDRRSPAAGIVANYDLIMCRNLLIYFTVPLQQRAFLNLFNSLNPGGYLILGRSESIPTDLEEYFIIKDSKGKIYQKRG